jgi:hypothetical protein
MSEGLGYFQRNLFFNLRNLDEFYANNSNLLDLGTKLEKLKMFDLKVNRFFLSKKTFDFSIFQVGLILNDDLEISDDFVGSFYCNYDYVHKFDIFKSLSAQIPEYITVDYSPSQISQLKDGNILISSYKDKLLAMYDNEFNLIRRTTKINNESFQVDGLTRDSNGNIFIINDLKKTIDLLDNELRLIKSIKQPSGGYYSDIFVYDDKLYACVPALKRIDTLSCTLEVVAESSRLDVVPYQIRVMNKVACVLANYSKIYFFDISSFQVIAKYDECGSILAYNQAFYVYHDTGFILFDQNGNFVERKSVDFGRRKQMCAGISVINNKLLICLDQKICKIFLK